LGSATAATLALLVPEPSAKAATTTPGVSPVRVSAVYQITLNGFDIGTFRFKSNVDRTRYALDTDVEISALLGVFHWKGVTHSTGTVVAKSAKPADFRFDYESSVRSGFVAMGFDQTGVDTISIVPTMLDPADTVPLTRDHIKSVLDPLSAIMVLTHTDASTPCGRKVPIFDGKQRFDLDLRYARKEPVEGLKETAIVCRVKYLPIAGYRANEETQALAATNGIEIAFRPVPSAKVMLPQRVSVPTAAGTAEIHLTKVSIQVPGGEVASAE
jgi:hypothetical protein